MSRLIPYTKLKSLYQSSPRWLQQAYASIPHHWRAGSTYRAAMQRIEATEFAPREEWEPQQEAKLRQLLLHAARHVPFYREFFTRQSQAPRPEDFRLADLQHLPLVSKSLLQHRGENFHAEGQTGPTYRDNTGGSSGTPFSFTKSNQMYPLEQAHIHAQWRRVGYAPDARKLTLRGRTFSGLTADRRWAYNPIYNELALSTYHLDPQTVAASMREVNRFRPRFVHGYPSAIVAWLDAALHAGQTLPEGIEAVLCGSEPIYDYQRRFIEETLGARVYSWYGQSECVLLAGECEHSTDYHSFPLYGILELLDERDAPISGPDVEGEIVGTGLNNFAMPFIRYRTGDRGILAAGSCPCGRHHPRLKKVVGRTQHYIYTRDRTRVPVTAFIFGQHFQAFQHILGLQLVQDEPGEILVRVCRRKDYSDEDERELRSKMTASVDDRVEISFDYVDSIPMNSAGKTECVIQHIKESPTC